MSKQINLLPQAPPGPAFSALRALLGLGLLLIVFIGYGAYIWSRAAQMNERLEQGEAQLNAQRAELTALAQKLGERPKLTDLVAQINALKPQADESREVINLLREGEAGADGYSGYFATIARISEEGVWLTGINISNAGKSVSLTGRALRQESVLRYARRMNEAFSIYGVQFNAVDMSATEIGRDGGTGPALSAAAFKLF